MKGFAIGSDHRGEELKGHIIRILDRMGYEIINVDVPRVDGSIDYPDPAHAVATLVAANKVRYGILICGSGIGVCIAANRHPGVRAATCRTEEDAEMTRLHNNANVLCIGADVTKPTDVPRIVTQFIHTHFEGGRHKRRVDKIEISC